MDLTTKLYFLQVTLHIIFNVLPKRSVLGTDVIYVNEGSNTSLQCDKGSTWSGPPGKTVYISVNDINPAKKEKISLDTANNSYNLLIFDVRESDEGTYYCTGFHPEQRFTLALRVPPTSNPVLTRNPIGAVFVGSNIDLTCIVEGGKPLATIIWQCGSVFNRSDSQSNGSIVSSVKLTSDKSDNGKTCSCIGSHPLWSSNKTDTTVLTVFFAPDIYPITQQIPLGPIIAGNQVMLNCTVSGGNPLATLFWNCTGAKSNNTSGNTASYSVAFVVNKTDNNRVCTCSATHPVHTYTPSVQHVLKVYFAPDVVPSIEQTPKGPVISGNRVTLTCSISGGNPLAKLSWDCPGNYTNNTAGNTTSYSVELTVDKADNNKICNCSATHLDPSYKANIQQALIVYFKPDFEPSIKQEPAGPVISGQHVTLTCTVQGGNPLATLSWNCNGTYTNNTSGNMASYSVEFFLEKNDNNRPCNCSATHPVPSYKPTVQHILFVYFAPDANQSIQQMPEGPVITGNQVTLTCNVSGGNPLPILSWDCAGKNTNNTRGSMASYSVELSVYRNDSNRICSCSATHPVSSYKPSVQHTLIVYYPPDVVPSIKQEPAVPIIAGNEVTLTCTVSGGNPLANLSWNCIGTYTKNTAGNTVSNSVMFTAYKTDNNRNCTCSATHPDTSYKPTMQHILVVYYPPNVSISVEKVNDTNEGNNLLLKCNADGNPATYKYHGWTQSFDNKIISESSTHSENFQINNLTFQDTGNYSCTVDNTILDPQTASMFIQVQFKPVLLSYAHTTAAKIDMNVSLAIDVFSFPDIIAINWFNESDNSSVQNHSDIFVTSERRTLVVDYHGVNVSVSNDSYRSILHIKHFRPEMQGYYTIVTENSIGSSSLTRRIILLDIPFPPSKFMANVVSSRSVVISWIEGFNGGSPQMFSITYGKFGETGILLGNLSELGERKQHTKDILDLSPSTTYFVYINASNVVGYADAVNNSLFFTTRPLESTASIIGPIGGAVGGICFATLVIILGICFFRIRQRKQKEKENLDRSHLSSENEMNEVDENGLKDNILYESSGSDFTNRQPVYSAVNKKSPKGNVDVSNSKETMLYAAVLKKPVDVKGDKHQYGNGNKKKQTQTTQDQKRDEVYQNITPNQLITDITNKKKNKDGLVYADLVFTDNSDGKRRFVIHGVENKTDYADIDLNLKSDPADENEPAAAEENIKIEQTIESLE